MLNDDNSITANLNSLLMKRNENDRALIVFFLSPTSNIVNLSSGEPTV